MTGALSTASAVFAVAAGLCLTACKPETPPPATAPALQVALETPQAAARSLLLGLQAQLHAAWSGDRPTARAYRDQIVARIAAREQLLARRPNLTADEQEKFLRTLVDNWASVVSYYADGLKLDEIRLVPASAAEAAVVAVPAGRGEEKATIHVGLVSVSGGWRVAAVQFAAGAKQPATATATAGAPATEPARTTQTAEAGARPARP
ncbi:MAG: hypothetical protein AB1716_11535 [Planctomycetota bacterium]